MRRAGLACLVLVGAVLGSAAARAGTLTTPPVPIDTSANKRALCSVVNGGVRPVGPLTITIYRLVGDVIMTEEVASIAPGSSDLLFADAASISTTSTVSCKVEGKGVGRRTPISLCVMSAASYVCEMQVQAP